MARSIGAERSGRRDAVTFAEAFDQLRVDEDVWTETAQYFNLVEMLDLAMVAGIYGLACRITVGLGIDIDEGLTKIADS